MICPNCGTENKPGRKFCGRCAAPLELICPSCGAANEPDMSFCGECGTALLARDLEGARATAVRHSQESQGNMIDDALGVAAQVGIAALEGRVDDAIAGYREAFDQLAAIHMDWLLALLGFEFMSLVGGDHPATREAAARSRAIFERVNAQPWLAKLDALTAPRVGAPPRTSKADSRPVEAPRA